MKGKTELLCNGMAWLSTMYKKTQFKPATHHRAFPPFQNALGQPAKLLMPALFLISFPAPTGDSFPLSRWVGGSAYILCFRDHPLPQGLSVSHASPAIHGSRLRIPQHTCNMAAWPWFPKVPVSMVFSGSEMGKLISKRKGGNRKTLFITENNKYPS